MKKNFVLAVFLFMLFFVLQSCTSHNVPSGWSKKNIGNVKSEGKVNYNKSSFTIKSSGGDISGEKSGFNFVYQNIDGDKAITALVTGLDNANALAKAGIIISEGLKADSRYAALTITPDNGISTEDSISIGSDAANKTSSEWKAPIWLRIVREGNIISRYTSSDGKAWSYIDEINIPKLNQKLYIGMAVASHDKSAAEAKFDNVSVTDSDKLQNQCTEVIGDVRVQILTPTLVRFEKKGTKGFEDRDTFHITERNWVGAAYKRESIEGYEYITTSDFKIRIPSKANSLDSITITKPDGSQLWKYAKDITNSKWLPGPSEKIEAWAVADTPRLIPSEWGFTPAPEGSENLNSNGWDLSNNAPDVYVFLPKGDYRTLRSDFISLTGRTEMVPLYALGSWDSRWYAYTEKTALQHIEEYRTRKIPLDVLVIDTDWRIGASDGYAVNAGYFPDIARFLDSAHKKNVKIMFNDHPEPVANPLSQKEIEFRYNGLSGLLKQGLDIWWYDRNWSTSLKTPNGINKEVWGMEIYKNITQKTKENLRPLIMANFDGIDNGILNRAPDIAAHRYSIQWSGDTNNTDTFLKNGIENAVYTGISAPFPYLSEDLGGHMGMPMEESYIRWMQYGALSPIYRPHCTKNMTRVPWEFGSRAENIVRDLLNMRYRLLPLYYSSARKSYDTGEPILRRCDLDYPTYQEAKRNDQFLLGSGILAAPIYQDSEKNVVPSSWLKTPDGKEGLKSEYYNNKELSGEPVLTGTDSNIDFDWGGGNPGKGVPNDNFSARWTGSITVKGDKDIKLTLMADDGVRLWIDDKQVIDAWVPQDSIENVASMTLEKGSTHKICLEYMEIGGGAKCNMSAHSVNNNGTERSLWLPPEKWIDAWTGKVESGNRIINAIVPLEKFPLYIKAGTIVLLAPEMLYIGEKPWDTITLDVYPSTERVAGDELYEDDTRTEAYKKGEYRKTAFSASADDKNKTVTINIDAAKGSFEGVSDSRSWVVRVRRPVEWSTDLKLASVTVDGKDSKSEIKLRDPNAMPFSNSGGSPDNDVIEVTLPSKAVTEARIVVVQFK